MVQIVCSKKSILLCITLVLHCNIYSYAQDSVDLDRKCHKKVAEFFSKNYHRGKFKSAKSVVGLHFYNFIENYCERNLCSSEVDENFTYRVIADQVNYIDATASIRYYWSEDKFLEVRLYQDENYDWFVYDCTRTEQSKNVLQLPQRMVIKNNEYVESSIDRLDYVKVAKYYTENYFHGNFENAIKVVKSHLIEIINIECIQKGVCDNDINRDFEFRKISESVDFRRGYAALKIYWTRSRYLDISLYQYDNGDWVILGCTPPEKAKEISTIRSWLKIPGAVRKS